MFSNRIICTAFAALLWLDGTASLVARQVEDTDPHSGCTPSEASQEDCVAGDYPFMCTEPTLEASNSDADIRKTTWEDITLTGYWLDTWLQNNGETDWVVNLDNALFPDGTSNRDCTSLDGTCPVPESTECLDRFLPIDAVQAYWVYYAVGKAFDAFSHLHEKMQDNFLSVGLDVDSIIADFDSDPSDDTDIFSMVAASFTMAAGASSVGAPETSALLSVANGVFSLAALNKGGEIDSAAPVSEQLSQVFDATMAQIDETLELVFSGPSDAGVLPYTGGGYATNTANFFRDGRWLLQDVGDYLEPVITDAAATIRRGVVNTLLKSNLYFVLVNTDVTDPDDCASQDSSGMWLTGLSESPDEGQCYNLFQYDRGDGTRKVSFDAEDDVTNLMKEKYVIDFANMYANAWECGIAHPDGDGKPDVTALPLDGTLPACFWNIPIMRGSYSSDYPVGVTLEDTKINTGGFLTWGEEGESDECELFC